MEGSLTGSQLGSQLSLLSKSSSVGMRAAPFVFGIDFGTTYTGVAWSARPGKVRPEDIHLVKNWDSVQYMNTEREKTPTAISYSSTKQVTSWGYNILTFDESVRWFKLLLLDDADLQEHLKDAPQLISARQRLLEMGKKPIDVIADYLRNLWSHVMADVEKAMTPSFVKSTPFRIIITVPAIWKSYMRERMREAANMAGLLDPRECGETELDFVSEPEAAAIATFTNMKGRPDIKVGTSITVVDAGGGTVDLISYQVVDTNRFAAREAVEGTGALCGAIFLDQEFETLVRDHVATDVWRQVPPQEIAEMMNQSWEHGIKQQFTLKQGPEKLWKVRLPARVVQLTGQADITLSSSTIAEIFDHVVSKILDLVDSQIETLEKKTGSGPNFVILVGGFGKSRYLWERLSSWLGDDCPVMQPSEPGPWTAICRGAVIRGTQDAEIKITSRISRSNYGHIYDTRFQQGVHDERDQMVDPITLETIAYAQIRWFVTKGENTTETSPRKQLYYRYYAIHDPHEYPRISEHLVSCDTVKPPTRIEPEVKNLCTIDFCSPIPFDDLPFSTNSHGQRYRYFCYSCLTSVDGASLKVVVEVNGETITSKNLSLNFESRPRPRDLAGTSIRNVSAPTTLPLQQKLSVGDDLSNKPNRESEQDDRSKLAGASKSDNERKQKAKHVDEDEALTVLSPNTTVLLRTPSISLPHRTLRPSSSRWSLPKSASTISLLEHDSLRGTEEGDRRNTSNEGSSVSLAERRALRRERRRVEADHIVEVPE